MGRIIATIFSVLMILAICVIMVCFMYIKCTDITYQNKGKKALINAKDTCTILFEQTPDRFRTCPREITVIYKDNEGKFIEQNFQEQMITIIP